MFTTTSALTISIEVLFTPEIGTHVYIEESRTGLENSVSLGGQNGRF